MHDGQEEQDNLILEQVGGDFVALDPLASEVLRIPGVVIQSLADPPPTNRGDGTLVISRRRLLAGAAAVGAAGTVTSLLLPPSVAAASTPPASSTTTALPPEPDSTTVPPDPQDPDFDIAVTPGDEEIVVEIIEDDA